MRFGTVLYKVYAKPICRFLAIGSRRSSISKEFGEQDCSSLRSWPKSKVAGLKPLSSKELLGLGLKTASFIIVEPSHGRNTSCWLSFPFSGWNAQLFGLEELAKSANSAGRARADLGTNWIPITILRHRLRWRIKRRHVDTWHSVNVEAWASLYPQLSKALSGVCCQSCARTGATDDIVQREI